MSRKLIIFICCLNVVLGVGVLWLVLKPNGSLLNKDVRPLVSAPVEEYTDEELWGLAREAGTVREAYGHLRRLSESGEILEAMAGQIGAMAEPSPLPFAGWPFFEALLQNYGKRAKSGEDLQLLAEVAGQAEQALALRDVAFRGFIENFGRLGVIVDPAGAGLLPDSPMPSNEATAGDLRHVYALIDTLHGEANSLSGTALLAEHYLLQEGFKREEDHFLAERATAMLIDAAALESNRLVAANVLARMGEHVGLPMLREAFEAAAPERLKIALLEMVAAADISGEDIAWLERYQPATPEQARLVRSILTRETQAEMPASREL